jgi:hypothetical protein
MHLLDLANQAIAQGLHSGAIFLRAVDLVAHLRDDFHLFRREPHLARSQSVCVSGFWQ